MSFLVTRMKRKSLEQEKHVSFFKMIFYINENFPHSFFDTQEEKRWCMSSENFIRVYVEIASEDPFSYWSCLGTQLEKMSCNLYESAKNVNALQLYKGDLTRAHSCIYPLALCRVRNWPHKSSPKGRGSACYIMLP